MTEAPGPEAVEVIDLEAEAEPPAAAPATSKATGSRGGGGRGGGRQRAPKRKGGNAAATANAAVTAAAGPNGLANGTAATGHDANGAAPMELVDGEAGGAAAAADSITSANAYLLVYRRVSDTPQQPPPQLPARCTPGALCCALQCEGNFLQYVSDNPPLLQLLWPRHHNCVTCCRTVLLRPEANLPMLMFCSSVMLQPVCRHGSRAAEV